MRDPEKFEALEPYDKEMQTEYKAIAVMVDRASVSQIVPEVVWSFAGDLKAGATIEEAVNHAMREWDI